MDHAHRLPSAVQRRSDDQLYSILYSICVAFATGVTSHEEGTPISPSTGLHEPGWLSQEPCS